MLYVAFGWSFAAEVYKMVYKLAGKRQVGFFDISGNVPPAIFLPQDGVLMPLLERATPAQLLQKPW
jgi:hypothetical protein